MQRTLATSSVGRCTRIVRSAYTSTSRPIVPARIARRTFSPCKSTESESQYDTEALKNKAAETWYGASSAIKERWENTEDKAGAVIVLSAGVLGLITASAVVDAIDRIPLLSDAIELVGVAVTGWFVYRYMIYGPDRDELISNLQSFFKKIVP